MFVNNEFEIVNTPEDFSKLIREYMGDEAEEYFNDLINEFLDEIKEIKEELDER